MGGLVCLTSGLVEKRIKIVIAMNPPYSFLEFIEAPRSKIPFSEPWFMKHGVGAMISFSKLRKLEKQISPKFYFERLGTEYCREKTRLVHCKDDKLVLTEASGVKIKQHLQLEDMHCLFLNRGDHGMRGQETIIIVQILDWLKEEFGSFDPV
jgi:hypothetical protein